jgi:hypothetical protein
MPLLFIYGKLLLAPKANIHPRRFPWDACTFLFVAQNDFAATDHLVVQPQPVFICARFGSYGGRSAQQAHACGGLENIGSEGAAVNVEFHAEIARIGEPTNLIAGVENHDLWNQSYQHRAFCHARSGSFFCACLRTIAYPLACS